MNEDPTAGLGDEPETPDLQRDGGGLATMAPPQERIAPADDGGVLAAPAAPAVHEPTELGDIDVAALGGLGAAGITPIPIPSIAKRLVTGSYRSTGTPFRVELRVDIDGARPTKRVSADYYSVSGSTVSYYGSMRVDAASISTTASLITITGIGKFTWAASTPKIRITIPRVSLFAPPAGATLQHLTAAGAPGATYVCPFASKYLRTVLFEQDRQDTVPAAFVAYNTGSLPSGGPARPLSVVSAYAEAGIQLQTAGVTDLVPTGETGAGGTWSDAELHAAMIRHFSLWKNLPQWAVWMFHAQKHDLGPGLLGIMFDQAGKQRQGAAVFYAGLAGATADKQRLQLYTCAHELGHCFNLLHSWQKSLATPPLPNRPASYSWMNYPWNFPGGPGVFWSGFDFQFDNQELVHLRHGFRDSVIMGGNPFATGSALEDQESWRDPVEDRSGLQLEVKAPRSFGYGEPVSVDLELSGTTAQGQVVQSRLRPRNGTVEIAIQQPSGRVLIYEPLLHQCVQEETLVLTADTAGITESAFIHYGRGGFYFDTPGRYRVRARTMAADGSIVVSNTCDIRVRAPLSSADEEAAELMLGDDQGTLLYLVGSDFEQLRSGNDALLELRERLSDHPLAAVARVVQGTNAAREFKQVAADNSVEVRKAQPEEATELLGSVLNVASARKAGAKKDDADLRRKAVATHILDTATGDAGRQLGTYVKSRRREIAVELGGDPH